MNNIGGIIHCEIIASEDIAVFSVAGKTARIRTKETADWWQLPFSQKKTTVSASPKAGDAGMLYEHKFSSLLPANKIAAADLSRYSALCISGCVIRYTDANGNKRILGTKDCPLTGTIAEVPGQSATSLAGYELNLKASEATPQLACIEI